MTDEELDGWIERHTNPTPWSKLHREPSRIQQLKQILNLARNDPFGFWLRGAYQLIQEGWW